MELTIGHNVALILNRLLGMAGDRFGDRSCTDFYIADTPENQTLVLAMLKTMADGDDDQDFEAMLEASKDLANNVPVLHVEDFELMLFLSRTFEALATCPGVKATGSQEENPFLPPDYKDRLEAAETARLREIPERPSRMAVVLDEPIEVDIGGNKVATFTRLEFQNMVKPADVVASLLHGCPVDLVGEDEVVTDITLTVHNSQAEGEDTGPSSG